MQLTAELADRLLLACSGLTRAVTAAAPATGMSLTQARTLGNLARQGPLRVSRLAALERCAQPTMTALVARCADAGLVTRTPDPADARAVLVALTDAGAEALSVTRRQLREPLARLLAETTAATGDVPAEHLATAIDLLESITARAWDLPGPARA